MSRLPRILSWLLLLGGALAWLLGPAPARPRSLEETAGGQATADPPPVEIWLDDADAGSRPPASPARPAPVSEPEATAGWSAAPDPERTSEWSESDPGDARAAPPGPRDTDAALDLVRRLLALHARMGEE